MPMFFDTLQHKLQGLCLLTQLIPSSHTQSISQIHNTVHLSGETSAECAQFTIMETMNNTATMSSISNISCDSSILCNTHSLYNTCIFAENWTWLCIQTIYIMHANDLRAYWQCSINITIVQTPMMTVIYKVIWRHRNLGCCCDPLVREASCRKQPRCQAPAYQPRHLALLTPRKLVSPDLLPNWRVLAQAPREGSSVAVNRAKRQWPRPAETTSRQWWQSAASCGPLVKVGRSSGSAKRGISLFQYVWEGARNLTVLHSCWSMLVSRTLPRCRRMEHCGPGVTGKTASSVTGMRNRNSGQQGCW
jgi:hypothetical protein